MKRTRIICLICAVMMLFGSVNAFAIGNGTIYDGSNAMTVDGGKTHTDPDGNTVANMTLTPVSGNYGKLAGDLVYEYAGFTSDVGGSCDYIGMWQGAYGASYVIQTQLCLTDQTTSVDYQLGFYPITKEENDEYKAANNNAEFQQNGNLFRIGKDGKAVIQKATYISDEQQGATIATLEKNRWYNIDVVITDGADYVTVYLNGEPVVINFKDTYTGVDGTEKELKIYGIRHFRISTGKAPSDATGSSASDVPFVAYMDNVSSIKTSEYNADDDKVIAAVSDAYTVSGNKITLNSIDASAEEVLSNVTADSARIRLYSDAAMTKQISGDDAVTEASVLVVAKVVDNKETSYNYYTFTFPGAESNMYSGTQAISLTEGGNASAGYGKDLYPAPEYTQALVYPTAGTGGKKASDSTYFWGGKTCGSGGHWFLNMGSTSASAPAHIFEMTFKLDEGAEGFAYGPAPFIKNAEGADTADFPNTYPFEFTLEKGAFVSAKTSSAVSAYSPDGTTNVFAEGSRNIKLGDIEPGKWHTFALVSYADGTNDFDVYFDGVKTSLEWNFNPGHMRHVRMYALKADNQKIYLDNFKYYGTTPAEAKAYTCRDAKANVELVGYEVEDNKILDVLYGTTVADLKDAIVTDGTVRVYADADYTTLASDSDEVTENTSIVVAAKNGTAYERALSYYSVALAADYDELVAKTRVTDLAVNEADGGFYVTFTAKNLAQDSSKADIKVAIAIYDEEDTLVDIAFGSASVSAGNTVEITADDGIEIANTLQKGTARAFVWWGDTQQPFTTQAELEF